MPHGAACALCHSAPWSVALIPSSAVRISPSFPFRAQHCLDVPTLQLKRALQRVTQEDMRSLSTNGEPFYGHRVRPSSDNTGRQMDEVGRSVRMTERCVSELPHRRYACKNQADPWLGVVMRLALSVFIGTALSLSVPKAVADPLFPRARVTYYPVTGDNLRTMQRALRANGPRDEDGRVVQGLTRWKIEWTFEVEPTKSTCEIVNLKIALDTTITLPHWSPGKGVSSDVARVWSTYLNALRLHERTHYTHGLQATEAIQTLAKSLPPGNCASRSTSFNIKAMRIIDMYRLRSRLYDQRTRHGVTEGVVLE